MLDENAVLFSRANRDFEMRNYQNAFGTYMKIYKKENIPLVKFKLALTSSKIVEKRAFAKELFIELLNTDYKEKSLLELGKLEFIESNFKKAKEYLEPLLNTDYKEEVQELIERLVFLENDDYFVHNYLFNESVIRMSEDSFKRLIKDKNEIDKTKNYSNARSLLERIVNDDSCFSIKFERDRAEIKYRRDSGIKKLLTYVNTPYEQNAYFELANAYIENGNKGMALKYLSKITDSSIRNLSDIELIRLNQIKKLEEAKVKFIDGNYKEANEDLESILETNKKNELLELVEKIEFLESDNYFIHTKLFNKAVFEMDKKSLNYLSKIKKLVNDKAYSNADYLLGKVIEKNQSSALSFEKIRVKSNYDKIKDNDVKKILTFINTPYEEYAFLLLGKINIKNGNKEDGIKYLNNIINSSLKD